MPGFQIKTTQNRPIRFLYYTEEAPITTAAFDQSLPFTQSFLHASVSGQEIWTEQAPVLNIVQENASVFTHPGEVVIGPAKPTRNKTAGCMGIYYGSGQGLDGCNIFARVIEEDRPHLEALGKAIWQGGAQTITFEKIT